MASVKRVLMEGNPLAPAISPVIHGQKAQTQLSINKAGLVVVGSDLSITVKKQEMGAARIGKIKTGPYPHIRRHGEQMVLGPGRKGIAEIRAGIKDQRIDFRTVEKGKGI